MFINDTYVAPADNKDVRPMKNKKLTPEAHLNATSLITVIFALLALSALGVALVSLIMISVGLLIKLAMPITFLSLALALNVPAIVLGHIAVHRYLAGRTTHGKGLAVSGLIISYIALGLLMFTMLGVIIQGGIHINDAGRAEVIPASIINTQYPAE